MHLDMHRTLSCQAEIWLDWKAEYKRRIQAAGHNSWPNDFRIQLLCPTNCGPDPHPGDPRVGGGVRRGLLQRVRRCATPSGYPDDPRLDKRIGDAAREFGQNITQAWQSMVDSFKNYFEELKNLFADTTDPNAANEVFSDN